MKVQVQKWGNSLALRIPKPFAEESRIEQGTVVDVTVTDGKLVVTPVTVPEYDLDDLLSGVTKRNIHCEVAVGGPEGNESW